MKITVFSDPEWATIGGRDLVGDDIAEIVKYDEQIIKPALLLADTVLLKSWRLDMQYGQLLELRAAHFGTPVIGTLIAILEKDSQYVYDALNLSTSLVEKLRTLVAEEVSFTHRGHMETENLTASPEFCEYVNKLQSRYRREYAKYESPALAKLEESGAIKQEPWDSRPKAALAVPLSLWEHENTAYAHGWNEIAEDLDALETGGILMDNSVRDLLSAGQGEAILESARVLRSAVDLLRTIEGLSAAPLDEVVDIRNDLHGFIAPFRRFILSQAAGMNVPPDASLAERQRLATLQWETDVAPAIDELRHNHAFKNFGSNLVDVAGEGPEAAIGLGLGLATAAASGAIGFTALAGLGVAALPTITKAAAATLKSRREGKRSAAFFVYEASRKLRRYQPT